MSLRPTTGMGYLRVANGTALWRMPGRRTGLDSYDPNKVFNIISNPNDVWSYGYMDTSFNNFTRMTLKYNTSPFMGWMVLNVGTPWVIVYRNITGATVAGIPPGGLALHPTPIADPGVLRFTSPKAYYRIRIKGEFLPGDVSLTDVSIRRGGSVLFSANDSGSFDLVVENVLLGETFDFCAYGTTTQSSTPLNLLITQEP